MASLHKKTVHGHVYWQIVASRRVNGKPRPIVLAHLGKADDLLAKLQPAQPLHALVLDFGAVAALWDAAEGLHLHQLINQHAHKRFQGHSVADYILIAAFSRALRPLPKTRIARWYQETILRRLLPINVKALSSQRFWDHMHYLDAKALDAIEQDLSQRLVQDYQLDIRTLFFDATNFDTFIDSANAARLPQRGHAKSKRTDLRIIGLALMVSADFHIPLLWQVYPGNQADSVTFSKLLPRLARRHRQLLPGIDQHITLVFDKGNNSKENIDRLARTPYHIIGSLVPSQHPDLLAIPRKRFRALPAELGPTRAYRTKKKVFSREWTIVITHSRKLYQGQVRGIRQQLKKKLRRLTELEKKLTKSQSSQARGKGYTVASLEKQLADIKRGQYICDILRAQVKRRRGRLCLDYQIDQQAYKELKKNILGKRILFTDNHNWSNAEIVKGYRGQHHVEQTFRDLKDPALVQFSPQHHWTDSKIRVHALTCVLALTLIGLVQRKAVQGGIAISRVRMMEELKGIKEVINVYACSPKRSVPHTETVLTERNDLQEQLFRVLDLQGDRSR